MKNKIGAVINPVSSGGGRPERVIAHKAPCEQHQFITLKITGKKSINIGPSAVTIHAKKIEVVDDKKQKLSDLFDKKFRMKNYD